MISLAGVLFNQHGAACSCVPSDAGAIESLDEGAEVVFVGTLKKICRYCSITGIRYQFTDLEIYKGDTIGKVNVWSTRNWIDSGGIRLANHTRMIGTSSSRISQLKDCGQTAARDGAPMMKMPRSSSGSFTKETPTTAPLQVA